MNQTSIKNTPRAELPLNLLYNILNELQTIKRDLSLIIPKEDIKEYAHPERVKKSYQRALKRFPVSSVWK